MHSSRASLTRLACDGCRKRKVKCDAGEPCSNCRVSGLRCEYWAPRRKRGPQPKASRASNPTPIARPPQAQAQAQAPAQTPTPTPTSTQAQPISPAPSRVEARIDDPVPLQVPSPATTVLQPTDSARYAQAVRDHLLMAIHLAVPLVSAEKIATHCIDLYMQYTFPSVPIVHEPTLRENAALYLSTTTTAALFEGPDGVEGRRAFALITALCASVASTMPESLLSYGHLVADLFFRASRNMLKSFEEYDLEFPTSSSLSIRNLHYTASQNITGKNSVGFHVLGEATLMALPLRLFDEQAIIRDSPVESQLLRLNFWHLYLSDQAAACLASRPCLLHKLLFYGRLTLHPSGQPLTPLLDKAKAWNDDDFEERLLVGFHLGARLWESAASLLMDLRSYDVNATDYATPMTRMTWEYVSFGGILDHLPLWLQLPNLVATGPETSADSFQKRSFWVQRCTLIMTFHCLRLIILQQCVENGLVSVLGISDQPLCVSMKKAELIRDFIQAMEDIPFIYHQVKGEPSVERIRRVGIILLEMIQTEANEPIRLRIEGYLRRLLDRLAQLNSKASEELVLHPEVTL